MNVFIRERVLDFLVGPVRPLKQKNEPVEVNGCFAMRRCAVTFTKTYKTWFQALHFVSKVQLDEYTGQISLSQPAARGYRARVYHFPDIINYHQHDASRGSRRTRCPTSRPLRELRNSRAVH